MKLIYVLGGVPAILCCFSCKSVHTITQLPADTYFILTKKYSILDSGLVQHLSGKKIIADVMQYDSILSVFPQDTRLKPLKVTLKDNKELTMFRYTFDIDILTIPFKVRPSVRGFPGQLNPNFSAALYFGRRRDNYSVRRLRSNHSSKLKFSGVGYGYGAFIGIGSVTMNPFVTRQKIDYEYDGFVFNSGVAGIYDAKKFNIGLAFGADFLMDKNRKDWIYQSKPWFGLLFGINLN
ncbi:hypothetical protein [Pedobacter gandavensis]|uniref:hypothetical protein n=1 Tax=Pedobacter gandavensis TaxID=2679963 RepID=UPI00292F1124|nr:hypothetical protein [Pedobacter gandavensis]